MNLDVGTAIIAGLIAGALMEGPVYLQKAMVLPVKQNIFRTWGNLFGQRGTSGYVVGVLFHQLLAAVIAIAYALFFDLIGVEANLWLWGVVGALVHYTLAGPVVAMVAVDRPRDRRGRHPGVRLPQLRRPRRRHVVRRPPRVRARHRYLLRAAAPERRHRRGDLIGAASRTGRGAPG